MTYKNYVYCVDTKLIAYYLVQRGSSISDVFNKIANVLWDYPKGKVFLGFDVGKSTYRKNIYSEYKGHRAKLKSKQSEEEKFKAKEFEANYLSLVEVANRLPVSVLAVNGVEADDLISIVCERYREDKDTMVYLVTGDMDYVNSVVGNPNVAIINVFENIVIDNEYVKIKYGDLLSSRRRFNIHKSLFGDKSDNIKFLRGFGEVKAKQLFELLFTKYENPTDEQIIKETEEFVKDFKSVKIHEYHIEDGRTTIKDVFEANMKLADTFTDYSKLTDTQLEDFLKCVRREPPSTVMEDELLQYCISELGLPIVFSEKAKKVFKVQ